MPPQQRTREQKITDVGARDQQNQKHHRHCDRERGCHVSGTVERRFPQWDELVLVAAVRIRKIFFQALRDGIQLGLRLLT